MAPYPTAIFVSRLTSLDVAYFRSFASVAPRRFAAVSMAVTAPYPHIEMSSWATFAAKCFGSRARIGSIALPSFSRADAGGRRAFRGGWKELGAAGGEGPGANQNDAFPFPGPGPRFPAP